MKGFCRVRLRLKYYILYLFVSGHQNWNKKKKLSSKIIIEKLLNGKYEKHLAQQNTVINIRTIENASRKLDFLLTTAVIIFLGVSSIIILGTLNSCCHQLVHNSLRFASFGPVIIFRPVLITIHEPSPSYLTQNFRWISISWDCPNYLDSTVAIKLWKKIFLFHLETLTSSQAFVDITWGKQMGNATARHGKIFPLF